MNTGDDTTLVMSKELKHDLFVKALTNHMSKLPENEQLTYGKILAALQDRSRPVADRIQKLNQSIGLTTNSEELHREAEILWLAMDGRESEIDDAERQALFERTNLNQAADAHSLRNLDHYLSNGIEVRLTEAACVEARRYCQLDTRDVPLIEKLKGKRLMNISGFSDSRVMYAVHDVIDHAWLFERLRDTAILYMYEDFLDGVDFSEDAFLYSRQAELIASAGFGVRRWPVARLGGEQLILNTDFILRALLGRDDPRTHEAAQSLAAMNQAEKEQLTYVIENMVIQMADERRRWGAVKERQLDGSHRPLDLTDPLYMAFMIQAVECLQRSTDFVDAQLAASLYVNETLRELVNMPPSDVHIRVPIPTGGRVNVGSPGDDADWIRRHLGVSTSYNHLS